MAKPTIELDCHDEQDLSPTYDIPIIDGGVYDTDKVLRWGDGDSADGAITNVTLPSSGNVWAPEFWLEDLSTTDLQLIDIDQHPDVVSGSQPFMIFKLAASANGADFATKARITAYDDSGHGANSNECFAGTTNHSSPFFKARGQTVTTQPPQYWGEASDNALHILDGSGGGAIACGDATGNQENCALDGDQDYLEASVLNIQTTPQYFSPELSVPDDATTGVDVITIVVSIRYTYT